MKEIISRILTKVEYSDREERFRGLPFLGEKFVLLEKKNEVVTFVDGGNAEIIKAPNFSVQFVRVYASIYEGVKKVKSFGESFYLLAFFDGEKYSTEVFGSDYEFGSFEAEEVSGVADKVRRVAELEFAKKGEGVIIIDGDLSVEEHDAGVMKELCDGRTVVGLSKTTGLVNDDGGSAVVSVLKKSPSGRWLYKLDEGLGVVKLHPSARYVFKIEGSDLERVASVLSASSVDPVFLGYPYGLIEVDRLARISNKEKEMLRMRFIAEAGNDWKKIAEYENCENAHDVLDSIQ